MKYPNTSDGWAHLPFCELDATEVVLGTADNNYPVIRDPEWAAEHLSISPANDRLLPICQGYHRPDVRRRK